MDTNQPSQENNQVSEPDEQILQQAEIAHFYDLHCTGLTLF